MTNFSRRSMFSLLGLVPVIAATACLAKEERGLTLESARRLLEAPFKVETGFAFSRCATGEPYVALTAGGIKPEGFPFAEYFPSEEEAVKVWMRSALLYAQDKKGTLYWREMPIAEGRYSSETKQTEWQVYSRLIITNEPKVFASEEELRSADGYVKSPGTPQGKYVSLKPNYPLPGDK